MNRDMTLAVFQLCNRISKLCSALEQQLQNDLLTTEARPAVAMKLLQLLDEINNLRRLNLRRDTEFEADSWLDEKTESAKDATEYAIHWYVKDPKDVVPPAGESSSEFVRRQLLSNVVQVRQRAEAIFAHIASVGAVAEDDWLDANET